MTDSNRTPQPPDLDAVGGPQLRELAHRMLDDILDSAEDPLSVVTLTDDSPFFVAAA